MILIDEEYVDWKELRKQKQILVEIRDNMRQLDFKDQINNQLSGILHLIDHVQDMAVTSGFYHEDEIYGSR